MSDDKFKIEHQDDPPLWTVYEWRPRLGFWLPFSSNGHWDKIGTATHEARAKQLMTKQRTPYVKTTYYNEHGHENIPSW